MSGKGWTRQLRSRLILFSAVLSVLFWIIESFIEAYIFQHGSLINQLFQPSLHEIWMRLLIIGIITSALYVNYSLKKSRQLERKLTDSEKQYQIMFENNPKPMWVYDLETLAFLEVNDAAVKNYGYTRDEFLSMTIKDIRPLEDIPQLMENLSRITEGLDRAGIWRHRKKNGEIIHAEITSHTMTFDGRRSEMVLANEITKTERRLQEANHALQSLIQASPEAVISVDLNGNVTMWNPAAERIFGWKKEEVIGSPNPTVPAEKQNEYLDIRTKTLQGQPFTGLEVRRQKKDGSLIDVSLSTASMRNADGTIAGVVGLLTDISERKLAEQAIIEEKNRSEAIIAAIGDGISIQDTDFKILYQNQSLKDLIGDHVGEYCYNAYEKKEMVCEGCPVAMSFKDGKVHTVERAVNTGSGTIYVENTASPLFDASGKIIAGIEVVRNITERKKTEQKIIQDEQDWQDTFNTISDMITVHDKDFNIIYANKAAEKILGLPLLTKTPGTKCFKYYHGTDHPPEGCPSCDCLNTGKPAAFEIFEPHLNAFVEIRAMPRFDQNKQLIGLIHVARDITDRKKREEDNKKLLATVAKGKTEWEMTFDSVMEIISLVDKEFTIVRCNKSFAEFAGKPITEMIGKKFYELFPWSPEETEYYRELMSSEERSEWIEIKLKTGQWFYVSQKSIQDDKGNFIFSVIIATDITALKNAQEMVIESQEELKKRIEDLERFYEMAVGRELKMKELKREIKKLTEEISRYKAKEGL